MRIAVVICGEVGSVYAPIVNTFKMADGFAQLGHSVTIICEKNSNTNYTDEALRETYGIKGDIIWEQIKLPNARKRFKMWIFMGISLLTILRGDYNLLYTRDYYVPTYAPRLGIPVFAETHAYVGENKPAFLRMIKAAHYKQFRSVITISDYLADYYISLGVPREKIKVLPTGVNTTYFLRPHVLPPTPYSGGCNIVYMGHLYDWKGIPTILGAAALLPEYKFHLVGGDEKDQARHRQSIVARQLHNVIIHGMKSQNQIPPYLWHADVLLLPPSANHPTAKWTSPVKLGEYLASGTPIVATSIPALRHWLNNNEVEFVRPDDAHDLARGIRETLANPDRTASRIQAGIAKARMFSYENRARAIISDFDVH